MNSTRRSDRKARGVIPAIRFAAAVLAVTAAAGTTAAQDETETEQDRRIRVLRTTNKAQTSFFVPKVYEFKNANPFDVRVYVQRALEAEEGYQQTFVAPDGKSGLYLVVLPEHQIPSMDRLMEKLDRPGQTTINKWQRIYVPTKHRNVADGSFVSSLFQFGGPDMPPLFRADLETNCMRFVGAPSSIENIQAGLEKLDLPTPQARIELTVYEVDTQNDAALGTDYLAWKNGPGRNLFAAGAYGSRTRVHKAYGDDLVLGNSPAGTVLGLPGQKAKSHGANAAYQFEVNSAFFDFLAAEGKARTVGRTAIMALSDSSFAVESVDRIPYTRVRVQDELGVRDPGEALDADGSENDFPDERTVVEAVAAVGVEVSGRVSIGVNQRLIVALNQSVSNLTGFDGEGVPLVSDHEFETELTLDSGQEQVIGGIVRGTVAEGGSKIPILGSIPGLGWLFGGEKTLSQKTMVVSVLKATRVDDFSGMEASDRTTIEQASGRAALSVRHLTPALDITDPSN